MRLGDSPGPQILPGTAMAALSRICMLSLSLSPPRAAMGAAGGVTRCTGRSLSGAAGGWWGAAKRAAEGVEDVLKRQAVAGSKKIFLYNVRSKLGEVEEARGMSTLYVERIREHAARLETETMPQKTDDRSIYHIQTACLVLASFKILTEQLRLPKPSAIALVRECLGDSDSSRGAQAVNSLVKLTSRIIEAASRRGEESASLVRTAHMMSEIDLGKAFDVEHHDSEEQHVATVHVCFYHNFFSAHAAPELTREIFCRADEALFEKSTGLDLQTMNHRGSFRLESTLAESEGKKACRFVINKRVKR